ncbi:MAG: hypothetical protein E6R13_01960 [Spirochaetes bacterium]|nr:MAG: hypothetical protein E6R13_01960 [Spirochaetota bacterium]
MSLIFFGAPHDMDLITCNVCRPIKAYSKESVILLCPAMKRFCYDQQICCAIISNYDKMPDFVNKIPQGTKSWNFMVSSYNDDVPDIVPLFHKTENHAEILEKVFIGLEEKAIEKMQLEVKLEKNKEQTSVLINVRDHILRGTPLK